MPLGPSEFGIWAKCRTLLSVSTALILLLPSVLRGDELQNLRKQVVALEAGQKEMQKTLQIIKDILMGKQPPLEDVFISIAGAPFLGDQKARITIVEFSDYQCPFCGRYATETLPQLIEKYVKTGKVKYVFRNFPLEQLHPLAEKAAEASACAGDQQKYWEAHDRFFRNQHNLSATDMPSQAAALGLDIAQFEECLESGKYASRVKADVMEGQKFNVRGTPSFFFGKEVVDGKLKAIRFLSGALPVDKFQGVIDGLLDASKDTGVVAER